MIAMQSYNEFERLRIQKIRLTVFNAKNCWELRGCMMIIILLFSWEERCHHNIASPRLPCCEHPCCPQARPTAFTWGCKQPRPKNIKKSRRLRWNLTFWQHIVTKLYIPLQTEGGVQHTSECSSPISCSCRGNCSEFFNQIISTLSLWKNFYSCFAW